MKYFDIFSKRERQRLGEVPEVYQYESIPEALRNQVIYIWGDVFGKPTYNAFGGVSYSEAYKFIHDVLCREHGMPTLRKNNSYFDAICNFFRETKDTKKAIDVIDISFQFIDDYVRGHPAEFYDGEISPDDAIAEMNQRFQDHGVGYQFTSGKIIRVDSEFIHSEVVKPTLIMLSDPMYEGANAEFLNAHEHYRKGKYKECLNECLKAFESCIKSICDARGWGYSDRTTAKNLIDIVFKNKLIPDSMQSHFSGLRSTLEAGVPTLRNRLSGHGDGTEEVPVQEYIAAYTLHLTASNILFLAKANEEMK